MHVVHGRNSGTDVEELPDAGLGKVSHRIHDERAVGPGGLGNEREPLDDGVGGLPVRGEIVYATEVVVVHPRGGRSLAGGSRAEIIHVRPSPVTQRKSAIGTEASQIRAKMRRYSRTSAGSSRYSAPTW